MINSTIRGTIGSTSIVRRAPWLLGVGVLLSLLSAAPSRAEGMERPAASGAAEVEGADLRLRRENAIRDRGREIQQLNDQMLLIGGERVSPRKQAETPMVSGNSTSIADRSAASDFISMALNLADLSGGSNSDEPTSASVTVNALLLLGPFLDRSLREELTDDDLSYDDKTSRILRSFSLTLGYDDEQGSDQRVILSGIKWQLDPILYRDGDRVAGRAETARADTRRVASARRLGTGEGAAFLDVQSEYLDRALGVTDSQRRQTLSARERRAETLNDLRHHWDYVRRSDTTAARLARRDAAVLREQDAARWSAAAEFFTKQREDGADDYDAMFVLEKGWSGLNFTANGGGQYTDNDGSSDAFGGMVAAEVQYQLDTSVAGILSEIPLGAPLDFALGVSGIWMEDVGPQYKGQLKVSIPLVEGLEMPISFSVANRSELIDETVVRGLMGFTVDTSKLMQFWQSYTRARSG
jgi:hypothetical protein